jgi:hypothetical protein
MGIMTTGLYEILRRTRQSYELQRWVIEAQSNARIALQSIADDFRHVSYGKDPTQPSIEYAGPDSVTFVADIRPEVPGAEFISYYLSPDGDPDTPNPYDTILMKTVADSGGVIIFQAPQAYGMAPDGLQFRYFNGQGVELQNPVPAPEQIGEIEVTVTAMTPRKPRNGDYQRVTLTATIYPRNLPLSPARSRPSTPACGPLSYPDCQSVTLPWETPTTNTDGSPLDFNDISHFNFYVGTHPDSLDLYARLARTFNEWTVSDLIPGQTYYVAVTCVSRSGVESYPCIQEAQVGSQLQPEAPQNVAATFPAGLNGVRLQWDPVTQFVGGGGITTPVTYRVYRGTVENFTPDPGNLLATLEATTQYDDTTLVDCQQYFYKVTAEACGNEGAPSTPVAASVPSPPSCPGSLTATLTGVPGSVQLDWTPPTTRMDGTPLDPTEIGGYKVLYDTIPGTYSMEWDVPDGQATSTVISGLELCQDYYFNVRAYDTCPALGDLCPGLEVHVHTAQPCDPAVPQAPTAVNLVALDNRINLTWAANTSDCDLYGYRIYYGTTPGGPYDGIGALEGDSPVEVLREEVTSGDQCSFTLNGLQECQGYFVVITAIDQCTPPNESPPSEEVSGQTDCTPCQLQAGCVRWLAEKNDYKKVHLEVYTIQAGGETLSEITPTWSLGHKVRQVLFGRPLVKIWDANGSAGEDGPVGPQPSGATLNVDDVIIDDWTDAADGEPLVLVFDGDMRGDNLELQFRSLGNVCSASAPVEPGIMLENMDNNNLKDPWTFHWGSWSVNNGLIYQGYSGGVALAENTASNCTDFIFTAKLKVVYGQMPYLVFRMQDKYNYFLVGLKTYSDIVRIARVVGGSFQTRASVPVGLNNNTWYNLTVRVEGNQIDVYLDCNLVLSHYDTTLWPSGTLGLRTYRSRVYYDDVQAVALNIPGP